MIVAAAGDAWDPDCYSRPRGSCRDAATARLVSSRNPRNCQLMFMHRPLYSSGSHESGDPRRFWAVGYNNRFELALAGHDHLYERFAPVDHRGNVVAGGIRSFVGTGGKRLFCAGTVETGSQVRFAKNYGALLLTLRPDSYEWEFRTISGTTIDTGVQRVSLSAATVVKPCHNGPAEP